MAFVPAQKPRLVQLDSLRSVLPSSPRYFRWGGGGHGHGGPVVGRRTAAAQYIIEWRRGLDALRVAAAALAEPQQVLHVVARRPGPGGGGTEHDRGRQRPAQHGRVVLLTAAAARRRGGSA